MGWKPEDYTNEEERFAEVQHVFSEDELAKLAKQKEEHEAGKRSTGYGHDLWSAIQRGHIRIAEQRLGEALDANAKCSQASSPSTQFAMTLTSLIKLVAQRGATADEIRGVMQRALGSTDHFNIEAIAEREGPKS